jgi:predicted acyltransferase
MTTRLYSLDVFRGITVAAMILVNNPGSWDSVYPPLLHASWHGCTPTDLIFPFFLFIVGVSIHFAYLPKKADGLTNKTLLKIVRRTCIIFLLGMLLAIVPKFDFSTVRIPGVLQRISIVFFFCAIIYLKANWLTQFRLVLILLVGYFILMTMIPVPGIGDANLEPETNMGAWLDRLLLEGHLWTQSKTWDPEGVVSTIPAIATGLIGMLAGQLFSRFEQPADKVTWLFFSGAVLIVVGLAWGLIFPINKALWTSSYVLYTGGIAMQFLAACYWLIDVQGVKKWSTPFIYYGTNAMFVFVASGFLVKLMTRIKIGDGENELSLWSYLYENLYASWLSPKNASLGFAVTLILFFLVILWQMYKRKIFVKV